MKEINFEEIFGFHWCVLLIWSEICQPFQTDHRVFWGSES